MCGVVVVVVFCVCVCVGGGGCGGGVFSTFSVHGIRTLDTAEIYHTCVRV